jgi:TonB family protein
LPEPPKIQASAEPLPAGPQFGQIAGPPPQIQPSEQPKISFETPGAQTARAGPVSSPQTRVPMPPKTGLDEMARINSRTTSSGGLMVGDLGQGLGGLGAGLNTPGAVPVPTQSALELMSDPMGVDFKPYLIRILSTVRRNWMAVIPESARMGRRGKVQIQFAINKDGSVPKLVIAMPSGAEALDRAAVAGVSASNPFPPLPDEFRGQQVRLQFTFLYNTPR